MKNYLSIFTILIFMTFQLSVAAQKDTVVYNSQNQEIGIDFQNLFSSTSIGGSLVYRKRMKQKEEVSSNKTRALRMRVGGFLNTNINNKDALETAFENITEGNGIIESEDTELPNTNFQIFILSGIEWQVQRKRLQYYTGFEAGYQFAKEALVTRVSYMGNNLSELQSKNDRRHSILLRAVGGCKFFLSPNFSIGIETNINSSFSIIRNTRTVEDRIIQSTRITTTKANNLNIGFDYLNALYFSYYF